MKTLYCSAPCWVIGLSQSLMPTALCHNQLVNWGNILPLNGIVITAEAWREIVIDFSVVFLRQLQGILGLITTVRFALFSLTWPKQLRYFWSLRRWLKLQQRHSAGIISWACIKARRRFSGVHLRQPFIWNLMTLHSVEHCLSLSRCKNVCRLYKSQVILTKLQQCI